MVSEKLDIREVGQAVGMFNKSTSCHEGWVRGRVRGVRYVCGAGAVRVYVWGWGGWVRGVGATNEASCGSLAYQDIVPQKFQ